MRLPLILIASLGAAALVGLPGFSSAPRGHGSAAVASLRQIHEAQLEFQQAGHFDSDGDGSGEAGTLPELAGRIGERGELHRGPSYLGSSLEPREPTSVDRSGYRFEVLLPALGGGWTGSSREPVDAERSETEWWVLAWPIQELAHEDRVFALNASGELYEASDERRLSLGLRSAFEIALPFDSLIVPGGAHKVLLRWKRWSASGAAPTRDRLSGEPRGRTRSTARSSRPSR